MSEEQRLWDACDEGNLDIVKELLSPQPVDGINVNDIDVNWRDPELCRTPFYRACFNGRTFIVEFLLKDPRIDVNLQQNQGAIPIPCCLSAKPQRCGVGSPD
jgi:ankyrin repeat protein